MKAIYNSRILPVDNIPLNIHNRAFCYGDGLFETIVTGPDRINLVSHHMSRLTKAGSILDIEIPFDAKLLEEMMEALKRENELSGDCRFRLQVWRDTGGLYQPQSNQASFAMTVKSTDRLFHGSIEKVSIARSATVSFHVLSFAKTMSTMPYVLAGLEAKQQGYDDLIILNGHGHMAETIASNLFWVKGDQIYTPAVSTGCIEGTMRVFLMEMMNKNGQSVSEVETNIEVLKEADSVFLTNASGIRWVRSFEDHVSYTNPENLLAPLLKQPQQP